MSALYEFLLYSNKFPLIFDNLYQNDIYNYLALIFILLPLSFMLLFYFFWKSPYGKFWHWFIWLLLAAIGTAVISGVYVNHAIFFSDNQLLNEALADSASGYEKYANTLPLKYALFNGLIGLLMGFLLSLFIKRYSKIQIHLPF